MSKPPDTLWLAHDKLGFIVQAYEARSNAEAQVEESDEEDEHGSPHFVSEYAGGERLARLELEASRYRWLRDSGKVTVCLNRGQEHLDDGKVVAIKETEAEDVVMIIDGADLDETIDLLAGCEPS